MSKMKQEKPMTWAAMLDGLLAIRMFPCSSSIKKLMSRVGTPVADVEGLMTLLGTHRIYTTSEALLRTLTSRIRSTKDKKKRQRCMNVVEVWVDCFFEDFMEPDTREALDNALNDFFAALRTAKEPYDMLRTLYEEKMNSRDPSSLISNDNSEQPPLSIPELNAACLSVQEKDVAWLLAQDSLELARQLTLLDSNCFLSIPRDAYFALPWRMVGAEHSKRVDINTALQLDVRRGRHGIALAQRFENLKAWTVAMILRAPSMSSQVQVIEHFINTVCACANDLNNFFSAAAIAGALTNHAAIVRLEHTWAAVKPENIGQLHKIVNQVIAEPNNFKRHSEMMEKVQDQPSIPNFDVALQLVHAVEDRTLINITNSERNQLMEQTPSSLIDFGKLREAWKVISTLILKSQRCQDYNLLEQPKVSEILKNIKGLPEEQLAELSERAMSHDKHSDENSTTTVAGHISKFFLVTSSRLQNIVIDVVKDQLQRMEHRRLIKTSTRNLFRGFDGGGEKSGSSSSVVERLCHGVEKLQCAVQQVKVDPGFPDSILDINEDQAVDIAQAFIHLFSNNDRVQQIVIDMFLENLRGSRITEVCIERINRVLQLLNDIKEDVGSASLGDFGIPKGITHTSSMPNLHSIICERSEDCNPIERGPMTGLFPASIMTEMRNRFLTSPPDMSTTSPRIETSESSPQLSSQKTEINRRKYVKGTRQPPAVAPKPKVSIIANKSSQEATMRSRLRTLPTRTSKPMVETLKTVRQLQHRDNSNSTSSDEIALDLSTSEVPVRKNRSKSSGSPTENTAKEVAITASPQTIPRQPTKLTKLAASVAVSPLKPPMPEFLPFLKSNKNRSNVSTGLNSIYDMPTSIMDEWKSNEIGKEHQYRYFTRESYSDDEYEYPYIPTESINTPNGNYVNSSYDSNIQIHSSTPNAIISEPGSKSLVPITSEVVLRDQKESDNCSIQRNQYYSVKLNLDDVSLNRTKKCSNSPSGVTMKCSSVKKTKRLLTGEDQDVEVSIGTDNSSSGVPRDSGFDNFYVKDSTILNNEEITGVKLLSCSSPSPYEQNCTMYFPPSLKLLEKQTKNAITMDTKSETIDTEDWIMVSPLRPIKKALEKLAQDFGGTINHWDGVDHLEHIKVHLDFVNVKATKTNYIVFEETSMENISMRIRAVELYEKFLKEEGIENSRSVVIYIPT